LTDAADSRNIEKNPDIARTPQVARAQFITSVGLPTIPFRRLTGIGYNQRMRRSGIADLRLHGGRVPQWLAEPMAMLGTAITEASSGTVALLFPFFLLVSFSI
jgi:hypothetical protein